MAGAGVPGGEVNGPARDGAAGAVQGREGGNGRPPLLEPGLRALVRLSAAVARGSDADFPPVLDEALAHADATEVEEALLQSYLFVGYPRALNAIAAWRQRSGHEAPVEEEEGYDVWSTRGEEVCRQVYGSAYPGLRENIAALRTEMDRWMVQEGYGKVLGRPGLALRRRECCIVAILAVLGAGPQLRSHLRGALRTGTTVEVLAQVLEVVEPLVPKRRRRTMREVWEQVRTRWEQR